MHLCQDVSWSHAAVIGNLQDRNVSHKLECARFYYFFITGVAEKETKQRLLSSRLSDKVKNQFGMVMEDIGRWTLA